MNPAQRKFVDRLLSLIERQPHVASNGAAEAAFRATIIDHWEQLVPRLAGTTALQARQLEADQLRQLRVLENHPSLLRPLGKTHDERSHTTLLAWLLGHPSKMGDDARTAFLDLMGADLPVAGWRVTAERVLPGGRRVDVEIDLPGQWLCFVEAKVDAAEGVEQLPDYAGSVAARGAGRVHAPSLVFLTVEGRKGDDRAGATPLTFKDLLAAWLPVAARHDGDAATYLSCWLVTLAEDLYGLSEPGPFHAWSFSAQRRALDLLQLIKESQ